MKLLLDTHVLLWAAGDPDRLPDDARTLLENRVTEPIFSAASLWEVAIKSIVLLTADTMVARYPGPIRAI